MARTHVGRQRRPLTVCSREDSRELGSLFGVRNAARADAMVTMVTIGGDLQPGCLADRLLTGLGQPQINP